MLPTVVRYLHYASAITLGIFVYAGWQEDSLELPAKLGAFPLMFVTGAYMFINRQRKTPPGS